MCEKEVCQSCNGPLDDEDGICHACLDKAEEAAVDDGEPSSFAVPSEEETRVKELETFLQRNGCDSSRARYCLCCLGEFDESIESCMTCTKSLVSLEEAQEAARAELRQITADWWFPVAVDKNPAFFEALLEALSQAGLEMEVDMDIEQTQVDFDPIFGYCTDFQRKLLVRGTKLQEVEVIAEDPKLKEEHEDLLYETIRHWSTYGQVHWGKMV